ncbi:MAG: 4Fe-4S binding protein [Omnitrophica bacterium]|nr:4Fe-4S binding protein [Candidatus Omnitrophota bacterium]
MARIKIDKEKCKGCMLCVNVCPKGIIAMSVKLNKKGVHTVGLNRAAREKCTGCAFCAIICPDVCIEVYR